MKIDTDFTAITNQNILMNCAESDDETSISISGLRDKNEIWLPPHTLIGFIANYCHEVGHILSETESFQNVDSETGLAGVLSIDQVKDTNAFIVLTREERKYIGGCLYTHDEAIVNGILVSIVNKLLVKFTRGKFNKDSVVFHSVSQQELDATVSRSETTTFSSDDDNNILMINSKAGRNVELCAYTTQFCCLQIFENTLHAYGFIRADNSLHFPTVSSPSHQRAMNIVSRAFKGKGWRLPSMKDIHEKHR